MARSKQTARKTTGGRPPKPLSFHSSTSPKAQVLGTVRRPQDVETSNTTPNNGIPQIPVVRPRQTARKSTGGHAPRVRLPVPQASTFTPLTTHEADNREHLERSDVEVSPPRRLGITARKTTGGRPPNPHEPSSQQFMAEDSSSLGIRLGVPVVPPMLTHPQLNVPSAPSSFSLQEAPMPVRPRTKQTARKSTGGHAPRMLFGDQR